MAALTIEVGSLQGDRAHHGLDATRHRAAGRQHACTGGTGHPRSLLFLAMRVVHDGLGHAPSSLAAESPRGSHCPARGAARPRATRPLAGRATDQSAHAIADVTWSSVAL